MSGTFSATDSDLAADYVPDDTVCSGTVQTETATAETVPWRYSLS